MFCFRKIWVQALTLSLWLAGFVAMGSYLNSLSLSFHIYEMGSIIVFISGLLGR